MSNTSVKPLKRVPSLYFAMGAQMGLCMMSTGMVSGYLSEAIGYQRYFMVVMAASVLPVVALCFAPFNDEEAQPDALPVDGVLHTG